MSPMSDTGPEAVWRRRGTCGRARWTPVELLAMVLGFMVFWPIGLGVLAWKMCSRASGSGEDWFASLREKFRGFGAGGSRAEWRGFGFGQSGNSAFDQWRKQEIERLEEERRKLEAAQKDFAEFVDQARRARDREEFERFMRERSAPTG